MIRTDNPNNFSAPIRLHPDNQHYFLFRGQPTILITSGEHYGAVLNLDFDYTVYLDELHSCDLNHTRLFSGVYREQPADFGIEFNSLAPFEGKYASPWCVVSPIEDQTPKYDLTKWNEAYFLRLKDFCNKASERGIIIEMVLFCPHYWESQWNISPMNIKNNINGIGDIPMNEVYTLRHKDLLACHTALTEKIVRELNSFDNVFYEICNEPWVNNVELEWQHHIADTIVRSEQQLPLKHLISQDVCNGRMIIENPHSAVSIFNFHYASPPDAVTLNYKLDTVIGMNETGFAGKDDYPYRYQAWELIMAGGALYNNLDYSFAPGYEKGTLTFSENTPGGGGVELRKQLKILKDFICSFDFIRMKPNTSIIKRLQAMNGTGYLLAEQGIAYAMYIRASGEGILDLSIPEGEYRVEWINPQNGNIVMNEEVIHNGGNLRLVAPPYSMDIALKILKKN